MSGGMHVDGLTGVAQDIALHRDFRVCSRGKILQIDAYYAFSTNWAGNNSKNFSWLPWILSLKNRWLTTFYISRQFGLWYHHLLVLNIGQTEEK